MSLAVLHLERRRDEPVSMAHGFIDRAWLVHLDGQPEVTFIDGRYLVALSRSPTFPSAGVAALPLSLIPAQRDAMAQRLVPAGLLAGVAIAVALLLLARRQTSLATAMRNGLRSHGVHYAQGWLFGKPQPFADVAAAADAGGAATAGHPVGAAVDG